LRYKAEIVITRFATKQVQISLVNPQGNPKLSVERSLYAFLPTSVSKPRKAKPEWGHIGLIKHKWFESGMVWGLHGDKVVSSTAAAAQ
jgi:hypothetical protein